MKIYGVDPMPDTFFDRKKCFCLLIANNLCSPEIESHQRS
jgi:hypothetical protein